MGIEMLAKMLGLDPQVIAGTAQGLAQHAQRVERDFTEMKAILQDINTNLQRLIIITAKTQSAFKGHNDDQHLLLRDMERPQS